MNSMNRINKFLEMFWLIVSILSVVFVVIYYIYYGTENNLILILLPIISITMYVFRRSMYSKFKDRY